jgi:hypothetical protein
MVATERHVLRTLSLPSRYEPLVEKIGPEVLNLLLPPSRSTVETLEEAAEAVRSLGEGLFLPIFANSGTGKTTLAENLTSFLGRSFTRTLTFTGDVSAASMALALEVFLRDHVAVNDTRVVPINVDHREGRPASAEEVSEIKRFLRQGVGQRVLLIWPETSPALARQMSEAYRDIAGVVPLDLPILVEGPQPSSWADLASQTLQLANQVDSLEDLVDLAEYDTGSFRSLGDFLKQIALDFNKRKLDLQRQTVKDVDLTILFVSETAGHGILSSLTSSRRYGMLDPSALLQACGDSVIGQWWAGHRGLLVQTIVALDAHAFSVSPPLALATFRRYGDEEVRNALRDLGFASRTPAEVTSYLQRSDLGRHLVREQRAVGETRGNPAEDARQVFEAFAEYVGFAGAKDKRMNAAFGGAIEASNSFEGDILPQIKSEKAVEFLPGLIPDLSIESLAEVRCLEFTYRKGDFLQSKNRSTVAQYCLNKLRNYARGMGWLAPDA